MRLIGQESPPAVKRLGNGSTAFVLLKRLLPTRMLDKVLSRKFGLAGFSAEATARAPARP